MTPETFLMLLGGVATVNNTTNVRLITDGFIIDKNYMFRPPVTIFRFYRKLYAKKTECLYNVRHRVSILTSRHLRAGQKFISYGLSVESF